jgi:membrane associated rhomboid family serine protease/Flp pilus assembly protein TadD
MRAAKPLSSITAALIVINLVIFVLMVLTATHPTKFTGEHVQRWGANYGPLTMNGQWWRLISALFIHIGLFHVAINMWCLYELGLLAEQIYGGPSTLLIYLLTGIAGGVASLARNPTIVSAGASGAIFGLAGALIATLSLGRLAIGSRELKIALASLLTFSGYNLTYGFLKGGIDNGAHVGGLISGLLIGGILSQSVGVQGARWWGRFACALSVIVLMGAFLAVKRVNSELVDVGMARRALEHGDPDSAIRRLSPFQGKADATIWALLGTAYGEKKQYAVAENYFQKALNVNPNDFVARRGLGATLIASGRLAEGSSELQKAVALDPTAESAWLELGLVLQKLDKHAEAVNAFTKAAVLNPKSSTAEFLLGLSEMNLRQYDAAIAAFQKATQLSPNDYGAQIWLANAYQSRGLTNEAAAAYSRATRLRAVIGMRPPSSKP